ncbi:hypothetical protein PUN28_001960 [Cardiocondyla obscurior]|uniref:Transmembrane protein n=1 Tax=Cardiocondyla obscurior TaxID=286306 RepID=A0AAW2GRZ0_9HYME
MLTKINLLSLSNSLRLPPSIIFFILLQAARKKKEIFNIKKNVYSYNLILHCIPLPFVKNFLVPDLSLSIFKIQTKYIILIKNQSNFFLSMLIISLFYNLYFCGTRSIYHNRENVYLAQGFIHCVSIRLIQTAQF